MEVNRTWFSDVRLDRRFAAIRSAILLQPSAPLPQAMGSEASTEAVYRFLRNENVDTKTMVEKQWSEDVLRLRPNDCIIVVHDSTSIRHLDSKNSKDVYLLSDNAYGYVAHVSMAIRELDGEPVGIPAIDFIKRVREDRTVGPGDEAGTTKKKSKNVDYKSTDKESLRWSNQAKKTDEILKSFDPESVIHVMDREGDMYECIYEMTRNKIDFVIRSSQPHRRVTRDLDDSENQREPLSSALEHGAVLVSRLVHISSRDRPLPGDAGAHPAREQRDAKLEVRSLTVKIIRPRAAPKDWPPTLEVNVVHVREVDPPVGVEPVEWVLWTSLPVDSAERALRVVDIYRQRWLIEEVFKALKTGCHFEKKRFESAATSQRALAFYLPIAANILRLRMLERSSSETPADSVVPSDYIEILRVFSKGACRSERPTVSEFLLGVAKLGGYLKRKARPGWQVLLRGYELLLQLVAGWRAARCALSVSTGGVNRN